MGIYLGGLIIGRIFASEIGGAYFREGFFFGGGGGTYFRNFTVCFSSKNGKNEVWDRSQPCVPAKAEYEGADPKAFQTN